MQIPKAQSVYFHKEPLTTTVECDITVWQVIMCHALAITHVQYDAKGFFLGGVSLYTFLCFSLHIYCIYIFFIFMCKSKKI